MNKFTFLLIFFVFIASNLVAQTPQKIKFQGIARDINDNIIIEDDIIITVNILEDSPLGATIYVDQSIPSINVKTGVFSLNIGENPAQGTSFEDLDWKNHIYFMEVILKRSSGEELVLGTPQQILSVPYALYGEDEDANPENEIQRLDFNTATRTLTIQPAGNSVVIPSGGGTEANDIDELQTISRTGTSITLSNNGGTVSVEDGDSNSGNELQAITRTGTNIVLSNGGGTVSVNDNDANSGNELQSITRSGSNIILSNGGGSASVNDNDADPDNEIQTLSFNTSTRVLTVQPGGSNVVIPDESGGDGSAFDELQMIFRDGDQIFLTDGGGQVSVNDDDSSPSNEIQTLSFNPDTRVLTVQPGGSSVVIPDEVGGGGGEGSAIDELQMIFRDGDQIFLTDGGGQVSVNDADADPDNEFQTLTFDAGSRSLTIQPSGNTVTIPDNLAGGEDDSDEFQTLTFDPDTRELTIEPSGNTVTIPGEVTNDTDDSDELQSLLRAGTEVILTNGGGQVSIEDGDADETNEIQGLTLVDNQLSIVTGGGEEAIDLSDLNSVWKEEDNIAIYEEGSVSIGTPPGTVIDAASNSLLLNGDIAAGYGVGNNGSIALFDGANSFSKAIVGVAEGDTNFGYLQTFGASSISPDEANFNVFIGVSDEDGDNGFIGVYDEDNNAQVQLTIDGDGNGQIVADGANGGVKNFKMAHPEKADKEIWYASLEGPEAAAYERGTVTLVNGEAEVSFSESFQVVINPNTMTVMTTPWSAESEGLAVIERTATGFKIKELRGGTGSYKVDWEVKAVRKGWEEYKAIRDKQRPVLPGKK